MKDLGKTLVVAAHPDDDILGCGGLISKYKNTSNFRVLFIAEGTSCRFNASDFEKEGDLIQKKISERNSDALKALKSLGVNDVIFKNLPCGRLDQEPQLEINKIIESEIKDFKPDTILTHSESDLNKDHRIVFDCVMTASRPCANFSPNNILSFEILSSTEWRFSEVFNPNFFVELSEKDIELKWKAMKYYKTEIFNSPHPRSKEGIYTLAAYRGMQVGVHYAEAYKIIREKS